MVKELFEMRKGKKIRGVLHSWLDCSDRALFGSMSWFIRYVSTLTKTPSQTQVISPIDIAGITATLGGLVLVGAFYEANQISPENKEITQALKRVGKEILVSSVCFIIIFFMLEYIRTDNQYCDPKSCSKDLCDRGSFLRSLWNIISFNSDGQSYYYYSIYSIT